MLIGKQQSYPCLHYNICSSPYTNEQASTLLSIRYVSDLGGDSALTLRHWATVNVAQVVHCTDLEGITYMIVCSGQKYSATLRPHPVPTLYCSTVFFQLPAMYSGLLVGFSNVCVCVCVCVNKGRRKRRGREGEKERCNRSQ